MAEKKIILICFYSEDFIEVGGGFEQITLFFNPSPRGVKKCIVFHIFN
jgi:hypothetical protein